MTDTPPLQPWDEHNQKLRAHVAPADWRNPTPAPRYNLVVIGGGTAGLVTAAGAAGLGAKVALIERHLLGGSATVDFPAVMERMRRIRAEISPHDSAARFRELGVDVFLGGGKFTSRETVEVGGQTLRFTKAVIATGARASAPSIPGLKDVPYLTNETVFSLTELPRRLAIVGAGPIGCEMAQSFARFGSKVTFFFKWADQSAGPQRTTRLSCQMPTHMLPWSIQATPPNIFFGANPRQSFVAVSIRAVSLGSLCMSGSSTVD